MGSMITINSLDLFVSLLVFCAVHVRKTLILYTFAPVVIDFHSSSLSSQPPFALTLIFNTIMANIILWMLLYNNSFAFTQYCFSKEL